jgi:hypothetical protein
MYNGGCSYALTCLAEKCLSPVYMPTWPSEKCLSPAYAITWSSEKCLSPIEAQLAVWLGDHRRHGRTQGTIITYYRGEPDGTPVLFPCSLS